MVKVQTRPNRTKKITNAIIIVANSELSKHDSLLKGEMN